MRLRLALFATTMFACRTESPRAIQRRLPDTARPTESSGADGCRQIAGQRPDTAIEIGTPAANEWRRRVARGITFACMIHPSLVLRIAVAGDTSNPSLDSVVVFASNDSTHPLQLLHRVAGDAEMPLPH